MKGREAVVELLLEKGADVECKSDDGRRPLWWAAEKGYETAVKLLLEKGADVESKDDNGQTPLSRAAMYAYIYDGVMKLLLKKGAEKLLH